ncbi:SMI1/KNR4 family protein [Methylobacillus arboreus]|uniref:SMI1/KNR4 family protein n=1 Tax=Methylobacillus arboreus TaxID=755170 RepID=UPI001E51E48B|nr:SMI1/KNR4 family protein [Methylobacillus arboreus]MCB5190295.1 SMI1/KNR4 family protein [Methylobacillus arboreus]
MKDLTWFESGKTLNTHQIDATEQQLEVKFPPDYISVVKDHSGASNPDECEFRYIDKERVRIGNFGTLLSLCNEQPNNVLEVIENLGDQLPKKIVPIIETGSGDYICFDYRIEKIPFVIYFSHERLNEEAIIPLTQTFTEFLENLKQPIEE